MKTINLMVLSIFSLEDTARS